MHFVQYFIKFYVKCYSYALSLFHAVMSLQFIKLTENIMCL